MLAELAAAVGNDKDMIVANIDSKQTTDGTADGEAVAPRWGGKSDLVGETILRKHRTSLVI